MEPLVAWINIALPCAHRLLDLPPLADAREDALALRDEHDGRLRQPQRRDLRPRRIGGKIRRCALPLARAGRRRARPQPPPHARTERCRRRLHLSAEAICGPQDIVMHERAAQPPCGELFLESEEHRGIRAEPGQLAAARAREEGAFADGARPADDPEHGKNCGLRIADRSAPERRPQSAIRNPR
jgi:hypothetical protein